jgi:DNA-binding NarL/FixJ family response regulator
MNKIKVHLVDDQCLVRQGMTALLQLTETISVTGESSSGNAFLSTFANNDIDADVILLDMRMPDGTGLDVLRSLQNDKSDLKCLILTTFNEDEFLIGGMEAGAYGYMLKDVSLEVLVDAITRVYNGETVLQSALTQQLIKAKRQLPNEKTIHLTKKEQQILALIVDGLSNKEISAKIFNAEGTVRNHVSNILAKLDVRDRTQATLKAIKLNLLE